MGNSGSINENIQSGISRMDNIDIELPKSLSKNLPLNKCSACTTSLNIICFRRKRCKNCTEVYCQNCLQHYKENIFLCYRCIIFISPNFSWDKLMELKPKDLKWYLEKHNIDCSGTKEKEQLVEIILEKFSTDKDQQRREHHRQQLFNNMENLFHSEQLIAESSDQPGPSTSQPIDCEFSPNNETAENNDDQKEEPKETVDKSDSMTEENVLPPNYEEVVNTDIPKNQSSTINSKILSKTERVLIDDINESGQIDDLSVKQLKDLLAYNKVDYKGCVERHELTARVQRLWDACNRAKIQNAKLTSTSVTESSTGNDSREVSTQLRECVICMDHIIDCVLLECGHMISCVKCGSQLAECPICRQNVIRVIRVFSAH